MAGKEAEIDAALQEWRQGDVTLDQDLVVVHLADKRLPLTKAARDTLDQESIEENIFQVLSPIRGLVVVTQSCDIVRPCAKSEFVDVCSLVPVSSENLHQIQRGPQIRYAYVPGVAEQLLVADLERTMAVEKSIVASWNRIPGCRTEEERIAFADALVRKRQRFAFPNTFNVGLVKFRKRLQEKRDRSTAEGQLIDALDHIRITPHPNNWTAEQVTVSFWFLLRRDQNIELDKARRVVDGWMKLLALSLPFTLANPSFEIVEQEDMTVRDYLTSYRLDYDDLSL